MLLCSLPLQKRREREDNGAHLLLSTQHLKQSMSYSSPEAFHPIQARITPNSSSLKHVAWRLRSHTDTQAK
ncbi:hypothetical protein ABG768_017293, partial [Culter alburnus]